MSPEEWLATQESQPLDPESWMVAQEASQQAANAAKEPSYWERINEPNAPERFNPAESAKRIGTSTALGGAIGTVITVV